MFRGRKFENENFLQIQLRKRQQKASDAVNIVDALFAINSNNG